MTGRPAVRARGAVGATRRTLAVLPVCLAALGLAGCRAPERGVSAAERDLVRGDLTAALLELDSVVPADPDYARARSLAAAVERRMRSAQRFLGQGLALRAEWRDDEALTAFQASLEVWPGLGGVEELIAATRIRCSALGPRDAAVDDSASRSDPGFVATTSPVDLPGAGAAPSVEVDLVSGPVMEPGAEAESEPTVARLAVDPAPVPTPASRVAGSAAGGGEPVGGKRAASDLGRLDPGARATLDAVPAQLRAGDVERALEALEGLRVDHPQSTEVRKTFTQVMHQKALLHYGQGDLGVAIETWERLLEDDGGHTEARAFLRAARTELGVTR